MKLDDDDFALFGLQRRFTLDAPQLDRRWRALQAEVHPDRFAAQGTAAQRVAMQWAVRVNEAYRRLKDPLSRGAYLCELQGQAIAAERNTGMPAEFLHQQMSWRDALHEAADDAEVRRLAGEVRQFEHSLLDGLQSLLDERGDYAAAAQQVRSLMFVRRFAQDVEERLEALEQ